jgi:tRNA (cmo5U34)-methyltransferase
VTEVPMARDDLFAHTPSTTDFQFGQETATVFDDMVSRSVPFYHELQRMTTELAADFAVDGTNLYDLGCATGTTLLALDPVVSKGVHFVGVDNSAEMLAKAREKLTRANARHAYELVQADLEHGPNVMNASLVILNLALQFVRPLYRTRVIGNVVNGMNDQGCLILVEKLTMADSLFNRLFIRYYYDLKRRNGYSDLEISRKREALENVLIPYRLEENIELLHAGGLKHVEVFFRWYNFCGIVGVK